MAASHVSGMKMRTLLFGVILGLLTVVHSTPVHNVTQIPAKAEDEVIREAATDGFLVENASLPSGAIGSPATGSPATNSIVQASQLPTAVPNEVVVIEGSDGETIDEATTASHAPSSASTMLPEETGESSSVSYATQSPPSSSTPVPNEAQPSATPDRISASQTTFGFLGTQGSDSGSGSGDGEMFGPYFTTTTRSSTTSSASPTSASPTSASPTSASPTSASPTSTTRPKVQVVFPGSDESGSGEREELKAEVLIVPISTGRIDQQRRINEPDIVFFPKPNGKVDEIKAEGTPGWMIIVGFIVGLAALVMLFVAIATRDKWNGPPRASMLAEKTNSSNQQREVEMKTFLQKDEPKENGHGSEYTVIPLEELPEKNLSH